MHAAFSLFKPSLALQKRPTTCLCACVYKRVKRRVITPLLRFQRSWISGTLGAESKLLMAISPLHLCFHPSYPLAWKHCVVCRCRAEASHRSQRRGTQGVTGPPLASLTGLFPRDTQRSHINMLLEITPQISRGLLASFATMSRGCGAAILGWGGRALGRLVGI